MAAARPLHCRFEYTQPKLQHDDKKQNTDKYNGHVRLVPLPKQTSISLTVSDLFAVAGLSPVGPISWGEPCVEHRPGVYVVLIEDAIVYIGRSKRPLSRRIREFYRHKYGDQRPHRGGQEVLNMTGARMVYWCATDAPRDAETSMLRGFEDVYGRLPTANRRRGDTSG